MQFGNSNQMFPVFFGVWIVLGLASTGFFFFNKNAGLKRKVWPPFMVITGLLFIGFSLAIGIPGNALYLMVPAVVLITLLNLRSAHFCNACGATIQTQNPFSKRTFCSKCGAKLER